MPTLVPRDSGHEDSAAAPPPDGTFGAHLGGLTAAARAIALIPAGSPLEPDLLSALQEAVTGCTRALRLQRWAPEHVLPVVRQEVREAGALSTRRHDQPSLDELVVRWMVDAYYRAD